MAELGEPVEGSKLRHSQKFPEGYGDAVLQSSDSTIFHFPSFLLAYSSPVFKDMFELATKVTGDISQQAQERVKSQPVLLSEDAITICGLLLHIDPVKMPFSIRKSTIKPLLEAARKYQLPTILQWFEHEVTKIDSSRLESDEGDTLIKEDPLFVLSLAVEYEMEGLVSKAILAAVNEGPIEEGDTIGDIKHYRLIHRLRQKRVERYLKLIRDLADLDEPPDDENTENNEDDYYEYGNQRRYSAPSAWSKCTCGTTRSSWLMNATEAILRKPRWESFVDAIESHDNCSVTWSVQFRSKVNYESTRDELCIEEQEIPTLP